jgi:hypothetical protein
MRQRQYRGRLALLLCGHLLEVADALFQRVEPLADRVIGMRRCRGKCRKRQRC